MITVTPPQPKALKPPTAQQINVLEFIRSYRRIHGFAPTMEEVAQNIGCCKVTVHGHVSELEKKGLVRRDRHKARSIQIVGDSDASQVGEMQIPVLGQLSAGSPISALEDHPVLDLAKQFDRRAGIYLLRVRGSGFSDHHFCDGDYIVLERRDTPRRAETIVATVDGGEAVIGRFFREGENVRIQRLTRDPWIVPADRIKSFGVVIGMIRKKGGGVS